MCVCWFVTSKNGMCKADIIIGFFNVAKPLNSSDCIASNYRLND